MTILNTIQGYSLYFIVVCFPIAVPLLIFYNWVVDNGFNKLALKHVIRISFGIFVGLMVGLALRDDGPSYYIGDLRSTKNLILYPLIGLFVEITRIIVVNYRYKKSKTTH